MKKTVWKLIFPAAWLLPAGCAWASGGGEAGITDRMAALVFQIAFILFAAWAGGKIFSRAGFPSILGELVAGIVIGPYALGGISLPGFPSGVFPLERMFPVSPELYGFSTVASIVLLFLVGLETDIDIFVRFAAAGSVIGLGGALISFAVGDLTAVCFSTCVLGRPLGFLDPIPLFLGITSSATSVGISARILAEKRRTDSPEGVTILSAAIIDDILGIVLLAVVIGTLKSGSFHWGTVGVTSMRALAVWAGFMGLGLLFSRRISGYLKALGERDTITVMAFALALLLAGIFEKSGLAMIIGAYIMGLTLSKTDLAFLIRDNLSILYHFFIPVFFCVMGMLVNPLVVLDWEILSFALVFSFTAVLAKILGCGLPALLFNFNWRGASRIGVGMIPRGEVAMIVAGIGLAGGFLNQEFFGVAVIMALFTTLIQPPVFARMLRDRRSVLRRKMELKPDLQRLSFKFPNPETGELLLDKVLEAFRREGFFIHRADLRHMVFHVRKNETFITLTHTSAELAFDCRGRDVAFVNTLVFEVLSQLERVMRNLQGLSGRRRIGQQIFETAAAPVPNNRGKKGNIRFFSPAAATVDLKGRNKEAVIGALAELFVRAAVVPEQEKSKVVGALLERERDMSTGMQAGVAFPHARTRAVEHIACAVGISPAGVNFNSLDKKPARIFIATLIPEAHPEPYLKLIADFSQFLSSEDNRRRLLDCREDSELFALLGEI